VPNIKKTKKIVLKNNKIQVQGDLHLEGKAANLKLEECLKIQKR
jgi:hypothetical protein